MSGNANESKILTMNVRFVYLLLLTTLLAGNLHAQNISDGLKIRKSEFKTEQEAGFKEAWNSLKLANDYFSGGVGTFALAREHYLFAHQYNSENSILNYRIGICYLYTDDKYEALKYLRKAYDTNPEISPDIHFYLGRAYHLTLDFDKAKEHYIKARDLYSSAGLVDMVVKIDNLIGECENGKKIVEKPRRVIITNMGDSVNSAYDDYLPVFADHDSVLYFTSRRTPEGKIKRNPFDNKYFEDIYACRLGNEDGWAPGPCRNKSIHAITMPLSAYRPTEIHSISTAASGTAVISM